jgi:hypothetical protein
VPRIPRLLIALTLALAAPVAASANGGAGSLTTSLIGGNCGATSTPFAQWGDRNAYYPVPDGGFESGGAGWTLSGGARVVSGNESFHVQNPTNTASLLLPSGAAATTPSVCFGLLNPGIRLFATAPDGPATIHLQIISRGLLGALTILDGGTVTIDSGWAPTPTFSTLASQLDTLVGSKSIQLRFTATGNVQIDDVYVDPFSSH